ncbi:MULTISPECIES: ABC transporter substrate-binding protein [Pseudofrankia]|uniref:ABC transporter substrate-binding protein n=1 Tax=Pseudofrankia TaxID=2994363 RepID=UPI000234DBC6|nr:MULTISPECIES: ABC transporter substrate-binding protein [Pseudofrankia]
MIVDRESVAAALPGLEIGGRLGSGAYGLVLAGQHRHLRHNVAIKVLPARPPAQGDRPGIASEGQLLGRMDHPHIVRVYDYVETADLCLIVMEQLVGGALSQRREGMRPEASCAVGLAVASALGYAHDRGVLHRDVKPDNVLFTAAGTAKVTDFGVAKILEGTVATASAQVGTPLYMAPEQITSGQLGPATDIYALGVVLYQLLSGAPPIDRSLPVQQLWQRRLTAPPPRPPGVPAAVANVVLRALAPDPAMRYPSARAFGLEFAAAAAAVLGRGWLTRSDLQVQLDDDVRAAADGPPTGPRFTAGQPSAGHPGTRAAAAGPGAAAGLPATAGKPVGTSDGPTLPVGGHPQSNPWAIPVPPPPTAPLPTAPSPGQPGPARLASAGPGIPAAQPTQVGTPFAPHQVPQVPSPAPMAPTPAPAAPRAGRHRRRWWLLVGGVVGALAIILPLVLIPREDGPKAGTGPGQPTAAATQSTTPRLAVQGPILRPSTGKGGTLRVAAAADCDSWDPQRSNSDECWAQQRWFSRQLLTYKPGTTDLIGDLATGVPTSTDAVTWRYTLRAGLKFEDGTSITSRDIKYGIERVFDAQLVTTGLKGLTRYLDDPNNKYPGPYQDPSPDKLGLRSIETPDDQTIVFHLTTPFGDWNYLMASPASTPVPRAKDTGAQYADRPFSSGPYKFASYQRGQSLTLVRNLSWDPATDPVNTALPDRIEEAMRLPRQTIDEQILSGHSDVFAGQTGALPLTLDRAPTDSAMRANQRLTVTSGVVRSLSLTTTVAPFDNVHCRKAIAWAIDRQAQVTAHGGPDEAVAATTLVSPPMRYHSTLDLYPSAGGHGDASQARRELATCGRPAGFPVKLAVADDDTSQQEANAIKKTLAGIGVDVQLSALDSDAFFNLIFTPQKMRDQGIGLALVGYDPGWPAPAGLLASLTDGRRILAANNRNLAELNDPAVNTALDDAFLADITDSTRAADPAGTAATRWAAAQRLILDTAAYIPLTCDRVTNIYSSGLTNVYYQPAYDTIDFSALGVR